MIKSLFITLLFPLICFSQDLQNIEIDLCPYKNNSEFDYLKKIDSLTHEIFNNLKFHKIELKFDYLIDTLEIDKLNIITTNYSTNTKSNFYFKNDNLSYILDYNFDNFRRNFDNEKNLKIFVFLDSKNELNEKLQTIGFKDYKIGILKTGKFISCTFFDKHRDRFLRISYYFENKELIKTEIMELNAQFHRDMKNQYIFYFKKNKEVFYYSSNYITVGGFGIDSKYLKQELFELSNEIIKEINKLPR